MGNLKAFLTLKIPLHKCGRGGNCNPFKKLKISRTCGCVSSAWTRTDIGTIRLDFDDTYDGLGDQLEEAGDDFNDDTFGGGIEAGGRSQGQVSKEFDFFGQTAQVSNVIEEEQLRYNSQQKPKVSTSVAQPTTEKPRRTGYEKYQDPGYIPEIQAKSSVWGNKPQMQHQEEQPQRINTAGTGAAPTRRIMSLAEVEAAMRAQSQPPPLPQHIPEPEQPSYPYQQAQSVPQYSSSGYQQQQPSMTSQHQPQVGRPTQYHQRVPSKQDTTRLTHPPVQILQNPNRAQHSPQPSLDRGPRPETPSQGLANPLQLLQ